MEYIHRLPLETRQKYIDEIVKIIQEIREEKYKEETELSGAEAEYLRQAIAADDEREYLAEQEKKRKAEELADEFVKTILEENAPAPKKMKAGESKKRRISKRKSTKTRRSRR